MPPSSYAPRWDHGGDYMPKDACKIRPDLAVIVAAWSDLPEAIKAGILAMVKASNR